MAITYEAVFPIAAVDRQVFNGGDWLVVSNDSETSYGTVVAVTQTATTAQMIATALNGA